MVSIPDQIIDSIKDAAPLERVLTEMYGKNIQDFKTQCDFHKDSSPSLHIFADGGYKCFVCGAGKRGQELELPDGSRIIDGGNSVFGYIMNKEQVSFPEAVRLLGDFTGIDVPTEEKDPEVEKIKSVVTAKNREFYQALMKDSDALQYLNDRNITKDDIIKWRIGMVPWDWADKKYAGRIVFGLTENSYQIDKAQTIAMAYRVREQEDYVKHGWLKDEMDKYLFAKYHESGKLRSLNPKYYNDSTNKAYNKSAYLYGMNYAQAALRKLPREKRYMVIMEGYTDVIMAHKSGVETAVACCSASITDEQADIISRNVSKVYLWLDGDEAGKAGMKRALPKLLERGCEVLIVQSPGMDPAEVVCSGQSLTEFIVKHSKHAVQLMVNEELENYDKQLAQMRMKALDHLLPLLDSIHKPSEKMHYRSVIESRLNVSI